MRDGMAPPDPLHLSGHFGMISSHIASKKAPMNRVDVEVALFAFPFPPAELVPVPPAPPELDQAVAAQAAVDARAARSG